MLHTELLRTKLPKEKFMALEKFVSEYINDPNVVGITLTGSFIHGDAGPNADLDVFIILEKSSTRTRGNIFIDGQEIEYFINPIIQIEQYYKEEYPEKINTAHMFSNCVVLFEKGTELKRLINLAKRYIDKPLPDLSEYDIYACRYFLDDLRKDLLDSLDRKDKFSFELISSEITMEMIRYFGKVKKFYPAKPKRLLNQFELIDKSFTEKLKLYLESSGPINQRYILLNDCISYIENLIGGPRPDNYSYTGDLST